jgi:hypothetical protein
MNWKKKIMVKRAWKTLSKGEADGSRLIVLGDTEKSQASLEQHRNKLNALS